MPDSVLIHLACDEHARSSLFTEVISVIKGGKASPIATAVAVGLAKSVMPDEGIAKALSILAA